MITHLPNTVIQSVQPNNFALRKSRLSLAILWTLMPFGHAASQSLVLVQLPKPSLSICSTIFNTLRCLSG